VVVQPGQNLGVTGGWVAEAGQRVVGEVRLPAFVRELCLEPLGGGLGALGGLWSDQPDPCLQVADYATWAIQRKHEKNDARSYNLIKDKIASEFQPFRVGTTTYY
jgi:hypothetical protein